MNQELTVRHRKIISWHPEVKSADHHSSLHNYSFREGKYFDRPILATPCCKMINRVSVTISVTKNDINTGQRNSNSACPVILALRRIIRLDSSTVILLEHLPEIARKFIEIFDAGETDITRPRLLDAQPFTFDIEVCAEHAV